MEDPSTKTLKKLQGVRKELIYLRRSIYPLRESINTILKSESPLLKPDAEHFFMDVYDHTIQVIESLETNRDLQSGTMDLYVNTARYRMNGIVKVLTIMSTIFIPLTFIAGVYGISFQHMPELGYNWAYPAVWILMIVIIMLILFKKKRWLCASKVINNFLKSLITLLIRISRRSKEPLKFALPLIQLVINLLYPYVH